jgi:hypothetical protein
MKTIWKLSLLWLLFLTAPVQSAPMNFYVNPDYSPYTRSNPAAWRVWLLLTDANATNTGLLSSNDWAAFAAEAGARIAADAALSNNVATVQTNVTAEAGTRLAVDTSLTNLVTAEAATRGAATTALTNTIASEATARNASDVALTNSIAFEAATRYSADTNLQNNIDGKQPLITLGTPGQLYVMTASTQAEFMTVVLGGAGTNTFIGAWPVILSTNTNGITITIQQAGPGTGGYLAASDWTNFDSSGRVTAGYLAKGAGSNLTASAIYESGGNVGINTTNTTYKLNVNGSTNTGPPTGGIAGTIVQMTGPDGANPRVLLDAYGGIPILDFRRANGTMASKNPIASNDFLGGISFFGYATNGYSGVRVGINAYAEEPWTSASQGTSFRINTTQKGAITSGERFRITDNGFVGVMTANPTNTLDVNGNMSSRLNIFAPNIYQGANRVLDTGYSNTVDSIYLKLTGGTLTGALQVKDTLDILNGSPLMRFSGSTNAVTRLYFMEDNMATVQAGVNMFGSWYAGGAIKDLMQWFNKGDITFSYNGVIDNLTIHTNGDVVIRGTANATTLQQGGTNLDSRFSLLTQYLSASNQLYALNLSISNALVAQTNLNATLATLANLTTESNGLMALINGKAATNATWPGSSVTSAVANATSSSYATTAGSASSASSGWPTTWAESAITGLTTDLGNKEPWTYADGVAYHFYGGDRAWHNTDYSHITGTFPGEPTITAGTSSQYWRGDKSWQTTPTSFPGFGTSSSTAAYGNHNHSAAYAPKLSVDTGSNRYLITSDVVFSVTTNSSGAITSITYQEYGISVNTDGQVTDLSSPSYKTKP